MKQNVICAWGLYAFFFRQFFHIHVSFISIRILCWYASQLKSMGVGAVVNRKWHVKLWT